MAAVSFAGAVLEIAVIVLCFVAPASVTALDIRFSHLEVAMMAGVPLGDRLVALTFELIPACIAAWGLFSLGQLFQKFAQGDVFSLSALQLLSRVTTALFWNVVTGFIVQAPLTYFLTRHNAPGHRFISLGFGSDDAETLFLAGVTFIIARVLAEARRVAEENAAFV